MKAYAAAIQILTEAEKPLHVNEISARILKAGLWQSRGETPEATVGAQIYTNIKNNGDSSPFVKVRPQTFALRDAVAAPKPLPSVSVPTGISFTNCAQKVLEELGDGHRCTTGLLRTRLCPGLAGHGRQDARSQHVRPSDLRDQAAAETG